MPAGRAPMRERPHRLPRVSYRGEVAVAFTARLASSTIPVNNTDVGKAMNSSLATVAAQHLCAVPAYCLVPDHIHLVLMGTESWSDTWKTMTAFKQRSGFWLSRHLPGTRWQKGFYDHVLRDESELRAAVLYIAGNPVRAGLAREPADHPLTGSLAADHAG